MGMYDYRCMISGVSLRMSHAVYVILEPTAAGPVPAALPMKGCYDRLGSIDGIEENANTKRVTKYFHRKVEAGEMIGDEDYLDEYLPFDDDIEQLLKCFERNVGDGARTIVCDDEPMVYTLICQTIWDAIVEAAPAPEETAPALFRRVFQGSTIAPEIYGKQLATVKQQLHELAAVTDFMASRGIPWRSLNQNDARQHFEEMGQYLSAARQAFSDSPVMCAALDDYERGIRNTSYLDADDYLGPPNAMFAAEAAERRAAEEAAKRQEEEDSKLEIQEFIFYVGDRNLGSFFMPELGKAKPEPIVRRLVAPPIKIQYGVDPALKWDEIIDDEVETIVWPTDTPGEVIEAQRLYDAAHSLDKPPDDATVAKPKRKGRKTS